MKIAKALGAVLVLLLALWGFGRFFLAQLGQARPPEPAAIIAAAPPEFHVVDRGVLAPAAAADALQSLVLVRPTGSKVGVRFETQGAVVYWLVDTGADTLEERAAGAAGTRTQTLWRRQVLQRLQWARTHGGDLAAPGLPPPERRNLYH
jgi:hypothetical protein